MGITGPVFFFFLACFEFLQQLLNPFSSKLVKHLAVCYSKWRGCSQAKDMLLTHVLKIKKTFYDLNITLISIFKIVSNQRCPKQSQSFKIISKVELQNL